MSFKVLPCSQAGKNRTFFYKSQEIRFKELIAQSVSRPPRPHILIEDDPWRAIQEAEVGRLIERLEDRPDDLYEAIRRKRQKRNKFTLLEGEKENSRAEAAIEARRKYYEEEFRALLRGRKSEGMNILLPKLDAVHYLFHDRLHKLTKIEKNDQTPPDYE